LARKAEGARPNPSAPCPCEDAPLVGRSFIRPAAFDFMSAREASSTKALEVWARKAACGIIAGGQSLMAMSTCGGKAQDADRIYAPPELSSIERRGGTVDGRGRETTGIVLDWPELGRAFVSRRVALPWKWSRANPKKGTVAVSIAHARSAPRGAGVAGARRRGAFAQRQKAAASGGTWISSPGG